MVLSCISPLKELFSFNDNPAIVYEDGGCYWLKNGQCHRLTGPAIITTEGNRKYYINGERYSEEQFKEYVGC